MAASALGGSDASRPRLRLRRLPPLESQAAAASVSAGPARLGLAAWRGLAGLHRIVTQRVNAGAAADSITAEEARSRFQRRRECHSGNSLPAGLTKASLQRR